MVGLVQNKVRKLRPEKDDGGNRMMWNDVQREPKGIGANVAPELSTQDLQALRHQMPEALGRFWPGRRFELDDNCCARICDRSDAVQSPGHVRHAGRIS